VKVSGSRLCFFCFFFYVVENGASNGVGQWHKTTRGIKFSKLNILLLVIKIVGFGCVKYVLFKDIDVGMNAQQMQSMFS